MTKENRFNIYLSKDNRKALERLKQEFNPVEEGMSISDFIVESAVNRWKRKKNAAAKESRGELYD